MLQTTVSFVAPSIWALFIAFLRKFLSLFISVISFSFIPAAGLPAEMEKPDVLHQAEFDEKFGSKFVDLSVVGRLKSRLSNITHCEGDKFLRWLAGWVPPIEWLPEYRPKFLLSDLMAGVTVGIMNIPQGMAYGMLAGLRPEYGLYTSLFPPLVYAVFGTSKHVSFGTFAVISLMVASVVDRLAPPAAVSSGANTSLLILLNEASFSPRTTVSSPSDAEIYWCGLKTVDSARNETIALDIAISLTMAVGLVQILLGVLNLGFLAVYLSDHLVQGLTTGAAVHVFTSQIGHVTGIRNLPRTSEALGIIHFYACLFLRITQISWATVITSVVCIALLILIKEVVDPLTRPKIKFPIPIELLLVIFVTLVSWKVNFSDTYGIRIVGSIPFGMKSPAVPNFGRFADIIPDALTIGIVIFSIDVSVAKLFAKKHEYKIDANQEWFAVGFAHVLSSFFSCHCAGPSLSRSLIQSNSGGKTQVVSLVSCLIILVVLLALAALFKDLPTCALASIILVALKGMFKQFGCLPVLFRQSKIDFLIWIVTFSAVVLLNITLGLAVGVGFALLTVIFRSQWPDSVRLGKVPDADIYKGINAYTAVEEIPGITIYRFDSPVYFANAELFKIELYKCTGVDPFEEKKKMKKREEKFLEAEKKRNKELVEGGGQRSAEESLRSHDDMELESLSENNTRLRKPRGLRDIRENRLHHIVIDCSSFPYIDLMAVNALAEVYLEFTSLQPKITVFFACCKVAVRQMFDKCGFYDRVPKSSLFVSIHDAVEAGLKETETDSSASLDSTQRDGLDFNERF